MDLRSEFDKIYDEQTSLVYKIFDMFQIYYGEDNVELDLKRECSRDYIFEKNMSNFVYDDLDENTIRDFIRTSIKLCLTCNNATITIHWPEIEIQNELGEKEKIYDLFCNVTILFSGKLNSLSFVKSTFTKKQIDFGYIHSHINKIYCSADPQGQIRRISELRTFCFGTAPINITINKLKNGINSESEIRAMYMLLCRELDVCMHIESIRGVPYIRISSLEYGENVYGEEENRGFYFGGNAYLCGFAKYVMKNIDLKYYYDGQYEIGYSFNDIAKKLSKMFLEYVRKDPDEAELRIKTYMTDVILRNGKMYVKSEGAYSGPMESYISENNCPIIKFKGRVYNLKIVDDDDTDDRSIKILNSAITRRVADLITAIINSPIKQINGNADSNPQQDEKIRYRFVF